MYINKFNIIVINPRYTLEKINLNGFETNIEIGGSQTSHITWFLRWI